MSKVCTNESGNTFSQMMLAAVFLLLLSGAKAHFSSPDEVDDEVFEGTGEGTAGMHHIRHVMHSLDFLPFQIEE
jgi:hypothetical protein